MGRLWQTLILSQWQDIFSYLPAFHDTYTSVSILPHIINQTLH
jgi:hypothetical protein